MRGLRGMSGLTSRRRLRLGEEEVWGAGKGSQRGKEGAKSTSPLIVLTDSVIVGKIVGFTGRFIKTAGRARALGVRGVGFGGSRRVGSKP